MILQQAHFPNDKVLAVSLIFKTAVVVFRATQHTSYESHGKNSLTFPYTLFQTHIVFFQSHIECAESLYMLFFRLIQPFLELYRACWVAIIYMISFTIIIGKKRHAQASLFILLLNYSRNYLTAIKKTFVKGTLMQI